MTMAERQPDFEQHAATYRAFISGAIAMILSSVFVLVGLASVAFGSTLPVFLAFVGIVLGLISIGISVRTGAGSWGLPLGLLAVFGLITAINVS